MTTPAPASPSQPAPRRTDWYLVGIVSAFFLCLLPAASFYINQYIDENFYTDSAILMLDSGDPMVPLYANGRVRALKPILTYWALLVSYATLGVSAFSSRLPFLLGGCAALVLVYRIALRVAAGNVAVARLAALIAACNTLFLLSSFRSTTDVFLCVTFLISLLGFMKIIDGGRSDPLAHFLAYGGVGLGIAVKGLLPLLFLLVILLFFFWLRPNGRTLRDLVNLPAMGLGIFLAGWWYVYIHALQPDLLRSDFLNDQFVEKYELELEDIIKHLKGYFFYIGAVFLPWILIFLTRQGRATFRTLWSRPGPHRFEQLTALWLAFITLVFSGGHIEKMIYMLPFAPFLCIVLARVHVGAPEASRRVLLLAVRIMSVLYLLLAVFMGLMMMRLVSPGFGIFSALVFALVGVALWICGQRWPPAPVFAASILVLFPVSVMVIAPVALPDPGTMAARAVEARGLQGLREVYFHGYRMDGSKIRVALHGKTKVIPVSLYRARKLRGRALLIADKPLPEISKRPGVSTEVIRSRVSYIPYGLVFRHFWNDQIVGIMDEARNVYYLYELPAETK
ncbi:MAG: glycosyltransferase family 39 protein [Verrucomicrobiae bacterium]|nr:glycosyltransferase family 39 protein [Verrucomicrobiae bacterium]